MPTTEMFVTLKVPDNVAITALNTLKRMGYSKIISLERSDCYRFKISSNEDKFKREISNVDILVNANKHRFSFSLEDSKDKKQKNKNNDYKKINILVQDLDNGSGLLSTLKERLGFRSIKSMEKGVLWTIYFDKGADAEKTAIDITKNLLMNENFQKFRMIK